MSIGTKIKELRREKGITQEQLAESLGITSRAVSQWECDRTAPDISQLPALCHLFNISSDALLGIDIEKSEEEIRKILIEASELGNQGKRKERTLLLREGNKRFPRNYQIMQCLANSLVSEHSRSNDSNYDEVFSLCKKILSECTDSITRYNAIDTLATAYDYAGLEDEMLNLAKEMPPTCFSYENFMMYRWKGDADFKKVREYLSFLIDSTLEMLTLIAGQRHDHGEFIYPLEERIELWKTAVALLELLFPKGDYLLKAQLGENACRLIAGSYLHAGDGEEAFRYVSKAADYAIKMDTYDFQAAHISPVLRGFSDGGWITEPNGNHSRDLLDYLVSEGRCDILRRHSGYEALIERLGAVAAKA